MARDQRPGRLRLGHRFGRVHAALSRLLIAALPAPLGRFVMFNHVAEEIKLEDRKILRLDNEESVPRLRTIRMARWASFAWKTGLPVWHYESARCGWKSGSCCRTCRTRFTSFTALCRARLASGCGCGPRSISGRTKRR